MQIKITNNRNGLVAIKNISYYSKSDILKIINFYNNHSFYSAELSRKESKNETNVYITISNIFIC